MYNNKGYIGFKRSNRSQEAIENYVLPLSLIKKDKINAYLKEYSCFYNERQLEKLKGYPVRFWHYIAKNVLPQTEWHHTGKFYRKTYHYDLEKIAEAILENGKEYYKNYQEQSKISKKTKLKYGIIEVNVFGGSYKRPTYLGTDKQEGLVKNDYLYFNDCGKIKKYKISANKVVDFQSYNSYKELVSNNKEHKTNKYFNEILKKIGA